MSQEPMPPNGVDGLVSYASAYSVTGTIDRLESILRARGATIFARIDHCAAAAEAGLAMRPAHVLVFGNPKIGTPIMNAAPTAAIDLPFKALAWEDETGVVWLSYNSADYLARRHKISFKAIQPLAAIADLVAAATDSQ